MFHQFLCQGFFLIYACRHFVIFELAHHRVLHCDQHGVRRDGLLVGQDWHHGPPVAHIDFMGAASSRRLGQGHVEVDFERDMLQDQVSFLAIRCPFDDPE